MSTPRIAIPSFPGSNGEVDNLRALKRCGFDAFVFRWNDSREKLTDVDGYLFGAGFSYEDRGRAGMVAARDPLFDYIAQEAETGKIVIGNCNGAQVLVESGLIPLGDGLRMSLARNAIRGSGSALRPSRSLLGQAQGDKQEWTAPGFLNEWVYITRTCARDRCCASDWVDSTGSPYNGILKIPMAHGEGRFVTAEPDLMGQLEEADQIAFCYCDSQGTVSADPSVTPNGSTKGVAGICNPTGNVVAFMPHPERTVNGDPYFVSVRKWIESEKQIPSHPSPFHGAGGGLPIRAPLPIEIFIMMKIVNNEERTVEQAAHRIAPSLKLRQYRYIAPSAQKPEEVLSHISMFNPNKEIAYARFGGQWRHWDADRKAWETLKEPLLSSLSLLRRDVPDTGAEALGVGSATGVCYALRGVEEDVLRDTRLQEIFCNPHASTIELLPPL